MHNPTPRIQVDLTGRPALVTGASRGLGRAIAISLAAAGAKVACVATSIEKLDEVVAAIRAAGGTAEAYACDVANSERVSEVVNAVVKLWGGLEILVNNAGVTEATTFSCG